MYSTHNKRRFVIAERFIRTLKNKIYKHVYFDVLNDIVDKYNNAYHRTIKIKPIDVKNDSFAEYHEDQKRKVPGSNPARRSAGLRDPTSLRGSR